VHELSIAYSLLECVGEEAARRGVDRVLAVHIQVGALSGVSADALRFAWDLAADGTVAAGASLVIEDVPAAVHCPACQQECTLPDVQDRRCPVCGTLAAEVVRGRELELVAMEIPGDDAHR
jgi:hydrogenase nickel incorporation protein HypA/HybF